MNYLTIIIGNSNPIKINQINYLNNFRDDENEGKFNSYFSNF